MRKIKVILLEITNWQQDPFVPDPFLEPFGLECLESAISDIADVVVMQERCSDVISLQEKIQSFSPDVVGVSLPTSSVPIALDLLSRLKKSSRILTVVGGPHPSLNPEIVADESVDYAVIGEGEVTFRELIQFLIDGRNPKDIEGIAYWDKGLHVTKPRQRITDPEKLPVASRHKEFLSRSQIYTLTFPPSRCQRNSALIYYSRGCPFSCTFCHSPRMWGSKVIHRRSEDVIAEVQSLQQRFDTNYISFVDLTFNFAKVPTTELCKCLSSLNKPVHWFAECRITTDRDLLRSMREGGCSKLAFGVESFAKHVLSHVKKESNIGEVTECLEIANSLGILTKAFLILGLPEETDTDLKALESYLPEIPADELRLTFFTPFPGTEIFPEVKKENRIIENDLSKYDTRSLVINPWSTSAVNLIKIRNELLQVFYNSPRRFEIAKEKIRNFPELEESYEDFWKFLRVYGLPTPEKCLVK